MRLQILDIAIIITYLATMVMLGVVFTEESKTEQSSTPESSGRQSIV